MYIKSQASDGGSCIVTWATVQEERDTEHVEHDGQRFDRVVGASNIGGMMNHRDRDWLDTVGRRILIQCSPTFVG